MVGMTVNYQKVYEVWNGTLQLKEFPWPSYLPGFKIECFSEVGFIFKNSIYIYINLTLKGYFIFPSQGKSVLGFSFI